MRGSDRIATTEEFDARLEEMRQSGGDAAAFEEAVRSLASSLGGPVGWTALLKLARVGADFYPAFPIVPSAVPPVFQGRPAVDFPSLRRTTRTDGPRREPLAGESVVDYGRYLSQNLADWLANQGFEVSDDDLSAASTYVALLAREDFRRGVGWERSLDAHAVMMLTTERGFRHAGGIGLSAPVEETFFRWLHLASYEEVTPAHLREVAARRRIRRRHEQQPAGEVAVMVCETPLVDPFPYDELSDYLRAGALLTADQIRGSFRELAERGGAEADWAARARGFEDTGQLDLTPGAENREPQLEAYAGGHLLRWMLDREVPIGPARLEAWVYYAKEVADTLVFAPARHDQEKISPTLAHHVTMHLLRKKKNAIPLAEELLLLAWLAAQTRLAIHLAAWLEQRDEWIAGP